MPFAALLAASALFGLAEGLTLPCTLHGLSVSPSGFVALLADYERERWLPLGINEEDTETASSPEALTLLQLLQGIDLAGAVLPPELLQRRVAPDDPATTPILSRVCVVAPDRFDLCVGSSALGETEQRIDCSSAFEAMALAMRYQVPIEVDADLLDRLGVPEEEGEQTFARCFTLSLIHI